MNWAAALVAFPVNLLIFYCCWVTIKEELDLRKVEETKLENLKGDMLYINISDDELLMLEQLKKFNNVDSTNKYLRNIILDIVNSEFKVI